MALWRHVSRRVLFAVFAVYLVISVTFGFIALTANPQVASVAYSASHSAAAKRANATERKQMVQEAIREYKKEHNLNVPLTQRYVRWVTDITTLDWGRSYTQRAPVTTVIRRALPSTLAYLLPALAVALAGGIGLGVLSALRSGTLFERLLTGGFYLGFGIPNYWLIVVVLMLPHESYTGLVHTSLSRNVVIPAAVIGMTLLAGQLRYARAEAREYVNTDFLKLVRAKGASNRLVARHVLKNAALPLFSLFFADLLGVLVVEMFVIEKVLYIDGIGSVGLAAIQQRDLPLILGVALVFAFAGVVGNLIQDLAYLALDPRVDAE